MGLAHSIGGLSCILWDLQSLCRIEYSKLEIRIFSHCLDVFPFRPQPFQLRYVDLTQLGLLVLQEMNPIEPSFSFIVKAFLGCFFRLIFILVCILISDRFFISICTKQECRWP